jgi:glycosyltransferase involved in cell wall biosynthesis
MNTNIKICHLTSAHPQRDVRILIKECSSLAKYYNTFLVVVNGEDEDFNDVKIRTVNVDFTSRIQRFIKVVNIVLDKAIEIDADVYHIHDPELLRIVPHLKKLNKKVIYDAHEDLPRQILSKPWINIFLRRIIANSIEWYENRISNKCDGIITATPFIRDRFLTINKNTVDINNFPILEELLLDINYGSKTENKICYVGGITKIRGIEEITESIRDLDVTLVLAGDFLENGLREQVSQNEGWNKVSELGFVNREEVKKVYKEAKLGLVTLYPVINYIDALPVKMFEYMAAGLPVIASNFPLWKSIVEGNNCGVCVDPLNSKEISEAITMILSNPENAKEMGENGKRIVKEKYNWALEEKKLTEFYNGLIE